MNTDVLSETHTIPDFSTRFGLGSQRSILCVYDQIIDLESLQIKPDIKESFDAISDKNSTILILGTCHGTKTLLFMSTVMCSSIIIFVMD